MGSETLTNRGGLFLRFSLGWVGRNASYLLFTKSLLLMLGFGESVLAARLLGPEGKGVVFVVYLTASSLGQVLNCSLGPSLQYHVGRRKLSEGAAIAFAIVFALTVGGGVALLIAGLSNVTLNLLCLDQSLIRWMPVTLLIIPVSMLSESVLALFIVGDMVMHRNLIEVGQRVAGLLLLILFVVIAGRGPLGALEGAFISNLLSVATLVVLFISRYGFDLKGGSSAASSVLGFGVRQHGATIMARVMKRADTYLLLYFLGAAQVGIYSVAASLADLPMILARSMHEVILTSVSAIHRDAAKHLVAKLCRVVGTILVPTFATYALFMIWALPVAYGTRFVSAFWPFIVLLVATFCLSIYVIISGYLSGIGNPLRMTYIMSLSVGANLVLSLILIPVYGLIGNALATSVASLLTLWLSLRTFRQLSGSGYRETLFMNQSDWTRLRAWITLALHKAQRNLSN